MAGGGESEEGDYWPGYVDALTAMVKVLSFVMMLLAVAVFVLSQNVSKAAVEAIAKAAKVDVPPDADVAEITKRVMEAVEQRQTPPTPRVQVEQPSTPSEVKVSERPGVSRTVTNDHKIEPSPDAKRLSLPFEGRGFKIDGGSSADLTTFVGENKLTDGAHKILIRAYALTSEGALSEARRVAYYRAMMARKELVDRKIKAEDIRINVLDTTDKAEGSMVDIFTDIKSN